MHTYVKVVPNDRSVPAGKLADVELHFAGGELDGLRLIGFAVWSRRDGTGQNVAFPARQFTLHGEKRHYTLLRSVEDVEAEKRLKAFVLQAYLAHEAQSAEGATAQQGRGSPDANRHPGAQPRRRLKREGCHADAGNHVRTPLPGRRVGLGPARER